MVRVSLLLSFSHSFALLNFLILFFLSHGMSHERLWDHCVRACHFQSPSVCKTTDKNRETGAQYPEANSILELSLISAPELNSVR